MSTPIPLQKNASQKVVNIKSGSTQKSDAPCQKCPTKGLPILPVRYAVVSKVIKEFDLPAGFGEGVNQTAITSSKYTLRSIRPGFVYLHYQRHGAWVTQCYMAEPQGSFHEIPINSHWPVTVENNTACQTAAHKINSGFISILEPEQVSVAWIAYSEDLWTPAILKNNLANADRMQRFNPSELATGKTQSHCEKIATIANHVIEHGKKVDEKLLPSSTRFEKRNDRTAAIIAKMNSINEGKGVFIGIWDAIGITVDLNDYRLGELAAYQDFLKENAWKLATSNSIITLREFVQAQVTDAENTEHAKNENKIKERNKKRQQHSDSKPTKMSSESETHFAERLAKYNEYKKKTIDDNIQEEAYYKSLRDANSAKKIEEQTKTGWAKLMESYDEKARTDFVEKFQKTDSQHKKQALLWDIDYVKWVGTDIHDDHGNVISTHLGTELAHALHDYHDPVVPIYTTLYSKKIERILFGGITSQYSLSLWKKFAKCTEDSKENLPLRALLANQEKWIAAFKNANEKDVGELLLDKRDKLNDVVKSSADLPALTHAKEEFNTILNKIIPSLYQTIVSSFATVGNAIVDTERVVLLALQAKLAMAYGTAIAQTNVVLVSMNLTIGQWFTCVSNQLSRSINQISKAGSNFQKSFNNGVATALLTANLSLPANVANKINTFVFWIVGTIQEIKAAITELGGTITEVTKKMIAKGEKVIIQSGAAIAKGAEKTAEAAKDGMNAIKLVAHNLKNYSVSLPTKIAATTIGRSAAKFTKNSLTVAGSLDVKLAALAVGFQFWALNKALNDMDSAIGFTKNDAALSIGSAIVGLTAATAELSLQAFKAVTGLGVKLALRAAGFVGAAASLVDAAQAIFKACYLGKKADKVWMFQAGIAAASIVTAGAGAALAQLAFSGAATAFCIPVIGWIAILVGAIIAGIVLSYYAFRAEPTAIGTWLFRTPFGKGSLADPLFTSLQQQMDAMEMLNKQLSVDVEWKDFGIKTDTLSITFKRPGGINDALEYAVVMGGGTNKPVLALHNKHGALPTNRSPLPAPFSGTVNPAGFTYGNDINNSVDKEKGKMTYQWEETIKFDERDFDIYDPKKLLDTRNYYGNAKVLVRYYPDAANGDVFFTDIVEVYDDSDIPIALAEQDHKKAQGKK